MFKNLSKLSNLSTLYTFLNEMDKLDRFSKNCRGIFSWLATEGGGSVIPLQKRLFEMEVHLSDMKAKAVGVAGEIMARLLLERSGYEVVTLRPGSRRGDLLAINRRTGETFRVEVKTARRDKSRRWKFNLVKQDQYGRTDCKHADVVLLLAVLASGRAVPFVVPVEAFADLKTFQIRGDPVAYAGRFACYRQGRTLQLEGVTDGCSLRS